MELEFIKDKIYCKIFDKNYKYSSGIYSPHKCNDEVLLAEVQQNINNIKKYFGVSDLLILKQSHGNDVIFADGIDKNIQPEADASVTTGKGTVLAVLSADCVPVLLASADGEVIGAAHCGWKSAKADILLKVKNMMLSKGAKDIKAVIGPAIAQKSYEVDKNYYHNFIRDSNDYDIFFIPSVREDYFLFDLVGFVKHKLEQEEIELAFNVDEDTYSMQEKYPSYRRSVHQKLPYSQNILSTIVIK
jgi:YfiH family protein